jgi:hypothetical protein
MIQKYLIKQNTTCIYTAARAVVTKQNNSIVGANPSIINEQQQQRDPLGSEFQAVCAAQ